jgi:hypothetical protein
MVLGEKYCSNNLENKPKKIERAPFSYTSWLLLHLSQVIIAMETSHTTFATSLIITEDAKEQGNDKGRAASDTCFVKITTTSTPFSSAN